MLQGCMVCVAAWDCADIKRKINMQQASTLSRKWIWKKFGVTDSSHLMVLVGDLANFVSVSKLHEEALHFCCWRFDLVLVVMMVAETWASWRFRNCTLFIVMFFSVCLRYLWGVRFILSFFPVRDACLVVSFFIAPSSHRSGSCLPEGKQEHKLNNQSIDSGDEHCDCSLAFSGKQWRELLGWCFHFAPGEVRSASSFDTIFHVRHLWFWLNLQTRRILSQSCQVDAPNATSEDGKARRKVNAEKRSSSSFNLSRRAVCFLEKGLFASSPSC